MSPSRKAAIVGLLVGCTSLVAAPIALVLPGFLIQRSLSLDLGMARSQSLIVYITAGFVYAPIGLGLGLLGVVILIISIPIYIDAKRKERRLI
jgi:hypothetical protein